GPSGNRLHYLNQQPRAAFQALALKIEAGRALSDRDLFLESDVAGIDALVHPVYRQAREWISVAEGPEERRRSAVRRQQGGMHVQAANARHVQELRRQDL